MRNQFPSNLCFLKTLQELKFMVVATVFFCLKGISSCITRHDQLILWNPTTKEVHLIPHAPSLGNHYSDESLYGFGAINDDFKVVKLNISDTNRMAKINSLLKADVYDLSTKSWTPSSAILLLLWSHGYSLQDTTLLLTVFIIGLRALMALMLQTSFAFTFAITNFGN